MTHMLFPSQRLEKQGDQVNTGQSKLTPERQRLLQAAIIDCIVQDGRAFSDFDREGMRNFLSIALPGFKPPHRTTVRRRLTGRYVEYRYSLRQVLPSLRWIALTTDIWLSPRRIHYI